MQPSFQTYLANYGHAVNLSTDCYQVWQHVLIVPICGETSDCLQQLISGIQGDRYLIVACINRPDNHPKSSHWQRLNKQLINHLCQQANSVRQTAKGYFLSFNCHDIWLLDFNDQPFDGNQGVGLARKMAADSALQLIDQQAIKSRWIHSTDADVVLPPDYFQVAVDTKYAAYSLAFQHSSHDPEINQWQTLYDFKLRYYQQAMRFIGSPYDYIPLGSCLIVQADAYAKVRGFPIRSGGEDFYVLNKLTKTGPIAQPDKPVIQIKSRLSDRVPFGTGPALLKMKNSVKKSRFYHPQIFADIKTWYQQLYDYYEKKVLPDNIIINNFWNIELLLHKTLRQTKTAKRWQQFVIEWFDAFKLLKTVHALEINWPRQTLDALRELDSFWALTEGLVVPH